ncbi:DUF1661 domain-containing protein [Porphyromonas gulae]
MARERKNSRAKTFFVTRVFSEIHEPQFAHLRRVFSG